MRLPPASFAPFPILAVIAFLLGTVLPDPRPRKSWEPEEPVIGPLPFEEFARRLPAWEAAARTCAPDADVVARLKAAAPARIDVVFGSWCGDSFEGLPPLVAALRAAGNPGLELELTGLDRSLRDPGGVAERLRVERVPTVVVSRGGVELGRVVETPATTMDRDVAILLGAVRMDGPEGPPAPPRRDEP